MVISLKNLTTRKCRRCPKEFKTNRATRLCLQCSTNRKNTSSQATKRLKKPATPLLKKKKPKKELTKLRKECEDLAKLLAKIRDNWTCQRCGVHVEGRNAHGSHVIPVSSGNQFRFEVTNIKTLCGHCHLRWWHKNPVEAAEWFKQKFPERYSYLFNTIRVPTKYDAQWYKDKIAEYKQLISNYS